MATAEVANIFTRKPMQSISYHTSSSDMETESGCGRGSIIVFWVPNLGGICNMEYMAQDLVVSAILRSP